jgi:hypothetical protein
MNRHGIGREPGIIAVVATPTSSADRRYEAGRTLPDAARPGLSVDPDLVLRRVSSSARSASAVLLISREGEVRFTERTAVPAEDRWTEARHEFRIG